MPELTIYDDIGADFWGDGITAKSINRELSEISGDLTIRINSYGGDVFEGHAIYNLIKNYEWKTTVIVDGIAASAASVIAMAGDVVEMPLNSTLMIHDPWTFAVGNSQDMKKTAETLDTIKQTIVNVYKDKTGIDDNQISDMMTEETWLTADKAEEMGFAVKNESKQAVNNKIEPKKWINKAPKKPEIEPEPVFEHPNNDARKRYLEIEAEAL